MSLAKVYTISKTTIVIHMINMTLLLNNLRFFLIITNFCYYVCRRM